MLAMIRTIAPHDTLDDAAYALVVKADRRRCGGFDAERAPISRPVLRVSATVLRSMPEDARVAAPQGDRIRRILSDRAHQDVAGALQQPDRLGAFWL